MSSHSLPSQTARLFGSTPSVPPDVRFLLVPLPTFNMLPFGSFLDKLRFSADEEDFSEQKYCSWDIAGLSDGDVVSSSGVHLSIKLAFEHVNLAQYDYVVVFGGRSAGQMKAMAPLYSAFFKKAVARGVTLVTVDNACFTLASLGLLDGCEVAVHWRHLQEFETDFPTLKARADQLYCIDGKRISCAGGTAVIELAIELLAGLCGRERALKGLADMLIDETRSRNHYLKSLGGDVNKAHQHNRHVSRTISLMRQNLSVPLSIEELSRKLGLSRRQLDRVFLKELAVRPREYWATMRMTHAHWRLQNSFYSLADIAHEVSFTDVSYFCKVFKKHFGYSPTQLKKIEK
ncbi:GlxA family transcriptional regulator [Photobacterium lutimaris]|uniref:AraC family transcriptional regulator n=1 Tax=Photobacterium lutimaris TaxID=388278 RepID=A0A2T3IZ03_9GAMM|nr:helix-turn-helix domain-containing protein [Photobacterium lutimaris]PSU33893.1 AraC family transcriptional regulator [Photobacterium lutimaris]TDR76218.1 AraC family transcriptional regulator with amidase-like domain [Photobacterium lutimaris]